MRPSGPTRRWRRRFAAYWSAIEHGTHYPRDVTLGEDACRVKHRAGTAVLTTLRNLANGIYELEQERPPRWKLSAPAASGRSFRARDRCRSVEQVGPAVQIFVALLDSAGKKADVMRVGFGGVLVSTWEIRQRRHAEDDALAS